VILAAVSGGPDSVYLLKKLAAGRPRRILVVHVNYGMRGQDSEKDQKLVEKISKTMRLETHILSVPAGVRKGRPTKAGKGFPAGFEKKARDVRYRFLRDLRMKTGAEKIALAHTADDQVETILMRLFEGAGIGGLKGIPKEAPDGIYRPILQEWKEDIIEYLKKRRIPFRIDRSNLDTRFERNWIRHVLLPLLEKRYGKSLKKRIFNLGEKFRELDGYLEAEGRKWIRKHVADGDTADGGGGGKGVDSVAFRRKPYASLPSALRVKVLQRICFDRLGLAPNERLLNAMDRNLCDGGPSGAVNAGGGWLLVNRYEEAVFTKDEGVGSSRDAGGRRMQDTGKTASDRRDMREGERFPPIPIPGPGMYEIPAVRPEDACTLAWKARGKITPAAAKRIAARREAELFDAGGLRTPLTVRPLRAGDRIRPFGSGIGGNGPGGDKKVKEILIDRKVPRDERWGRPVVCDARGDILWIPGVIRSALAPVSAKTKNAVLLEVSRSRK